MPGILFLTSSEHGQSQVALAVAYALACHQDADVTVYIASAPTLLPRITALQNQVNAARDGKIRFHSVPELEFSPFIQRAISMEKLMHSPGILNAVLSYPNMLKVATRWTGPEYFDLYSDCAKLITDIRPDVVVVDNANLPGLEACRAMGQKHVILFPLSLQYLIGGNQKWGKIFWKYPAFSSAFPYPIPWYLIPFNIFLFFALIATLLLSSRVRTLDKYRRSHGITGPSPLFAPPRPSDRYLCASIPEFEYEFDVFPPNIVPCGPLVLPPQPIETLDPALATWVRRAPTVLVNLGSLVDVSATDARELTSAFKTVLARFPKVQVLWKLAAADQVRELAREILRQELSDERVRIERWLKPEPLAILFTGDIVVNVHHGGANSYHESTLAGVPQIVLPVWYDTYDYARRAEHLGIGIWGSRTSAPHVNSKELAAALTAVLDNSPRAVSMQTKARELGRLARERKPGREIACEEILRMMEEA